MEYEPVLDDILETGVAVDLASGCDGVIMVSQGDSLALDVPGNAAAVVSGSGPGAFKGAIWLGIDLYRKKRGAVSCLVSGSVKS